MLNKEELLSDKRERKMRNLRRSSIMLSTKVTPLFQGGETLISKENTQCCWWALISSFRRCTLPFLLMLLLLWVSQDVWPEDEPHSRNVPQMEATERPSRQPTPPPYGYGSPGGYDDNYYYKRFIGTGGYVGWFRHSLLYIYIPDISSI